MKYSILTWKIYILIIIENSVKSCYFRLPEKGELSIWLLESMSY